MNVIGNLINLMVDEIIVYIGNQLFLIKLKSAGGINNNEKLLLFLLINIS